MSRARRLARFGDLPLLEPERAILPPEQADVWSHLGDVPEHFVLYGGTALALRLGHRESRDFDFFSAEPFIPTDLAMDLAWLGPVSIHEAASSSLAVTTAGGVRLAFYGGMRLATVAEPSIVAENGVVVASTFDLAGTNAKAILDRSMAKDYLDIATLLRRGFALPEIIGYASAIFRPLFAFPAAVFLRSLAWFGDGDVADLPIDMKEELERAVRQASGQSIPSIESSSMKIAPGTLPGP